MESSLEQEYTSKISRAVDRIVDSYCNQLNLYIGSSAKFFEKKRDMLLAVFSGMASVIANDNNLTDSERNRLVEQLSQMYMSAIEKSLDSVKESSATSNPYGYDPSKSLESNIAEDLEILFKELKSSNLRKEKQNIVA